MFLSSMINSRELFLDEPDKLCKSTETTSQTLESIYCIASTSVKIGYFMPIKRRKKKKKLRVKRAIELRLAVRIGGTNSLSLLGADLVDAAADVLAEHKALSDTDAPPPPSPFEAPEGYLKRACFQVIQEFRKANAHHAIKKLANYAGRDRRQLTYTDNPFYWGLLAIDPAFSAIEEGSLSLYAKQLLHAANHKVPPEHLVGFIYQSGSQSALKRKVRIGEREEEFLRIRKRTSDLRLMN